MAWIWKLISICHVPIAFFFAQLGKEASEIAMRPISTLLAGLATVVIASPQWENDTSAAKVCSVLYAEEVAEHWSSKSYMSPSIRISTIKALALCPEKPTSMAQAIPTQQPICQLEDHTNPRRRTSHTFSQATNEPTRATMWSWRGKKLLSQQHHISVCRCS